MRRGRWAPNRSMEQRTTLQPRELTTWVPASRGVSLLARPDGLGWVGTERTKGLGVKPPWSYEAPWNSNRLHLARFPSPPLEGKGPGPIYLAENINQGPKQGTVHPAFFSLPALASLTDIMRPVSPTQKTSAPNSLNSAVGFKRGAPIHKGSLCLTISPPPSTPPALPPTGQQVSGSYF